ncbi:uncharacterized protein LOC120332873 [Styela clava]
MENNSSGPIYYEISPLKSKLVRGYGAISFIVAIIAIVLVGIKSSSVHHDLYLLVNIAISIFVCLLLSWFYKRETVGQGKWWFMIVVFSALLYQSIISVLFVYFHEPSSIPAHTVAVDPHTLYVKPHTFKPIHHSPKESNTIP